MSDIGKNPFMISFSKRPVEYISRQEQIDELFETFTGDPITDQLFMIV